MRMRDLSILSTTDYFASYCPHPNPPPLMRERGLREAVIPVKTGIQDALDTGLRRYDECVVSSGLPPARE
jgi:hypothetical protein